MGTLSNRDEIQAYAVSAIFEIIVLERFLIGLEQPIKIVDTSPNTTLPLVLEELNILITMKKMKVRSNLWILPEPCDQCMAEVDLCVDVEISVVVFQTIARDGTSRIII